MAQVDASLPAFRMHRTLRRLTRTSPDEIWFRLKERGHVLVEATRHRTGVDQWRRPRLSGALAPVSGLVADARTAGAAGDWRSAEAALRAHFQTRTTRFPIAPRDRTALVQAILDRYPTALDDAVARGDRVVRGVYDLLGYRGLSFNDEAGRVDWHLDPVHGRRAPRAFWSRVPYLSPECGDHKIIWELNRHQHWLTLGRAAWLTGDSRYPARFVEELYGWLAANPPGQGINWASMLELAFRSISWIWSLHFFAACTVPGEKPWIVDLLVGLDRQLDHIARHLSYYFSPNTHLLGEGLALYVAGQALPELARASRWATLGRDILLREATAQVHADGGHAELSAHYHRYALDFYLLALALARTTGDPSATAFGEVAGRMAGYCRALADDGGRLPTIGDDDGGMLFPICGREPADVRDSLALATHLLRRGDLARDEPEELLWMLGAGVKSLPEQTVSPPESVLFRDSGYAVLTGPSGKAVVDVGRHGFLNGGHAHADALSICLTVGDQPFLIDPGTCTYTMDPSLRDLFRSTRMHNTVVLDRRSQSEPSGPFHWATRAQARIDVWRTRRDFAFLEASHDGYSPRIHRRAVLGLPDGTWIVADHILGAGSHLAQSHWHLDPRWTPQARSSNGVSLRDGDGLGAALVSTAGTLEEFSGDTEGLGWCAPVYGQRRPSVTLRFASSGELPLSSITWVLPGQDLPDLRASRVVAPVEDGWQRIGAVMRTGNGSGAAALFATPLEDRTATSSTPSPARRTAQRMNMGGVWLETDARAAVLQFDGDGSPSALTAVDATVVAWSGPGAFTFCAGEAQDLHLDAAALRRLNHGVAAGPIG